MAFRKRYLYLIFALAFGLFFYQKSSSTEGFSKQKIASSLAPNPTWMIPTSSFEQQQELKTIFGSPFKFLGEGAQAYAFESSDGKYVLKFFKMRRFTPSLADCLCPHVVRRRLKNLNWVFNGYKIAYENFRQDTGLVFIHLAKTHDLQQTAFIIDEQGQEHTIDLDQTEFVLQEKAELLFERLAKLYQRGEAHQAEQSIVAILELVQRRIEKGYADRDKGVSNNYGFVGDRAIQLDIGRLYKGTKERQFEHVQRRIQRWQEENIALVNEQKIKP